MVHRHISWRARPTRREVLAGVTGSAATFAIGTFGRAAAAAPTPFTLGVASGEPAPDGVVLWTRLAPQPLAPDGSGGIAEPVNVTWEVAADDAMRNIVQRGTVEANRRFAHSVHVEVGSLEPTRPYWYRFTALGAQSPVGRTRTAPAPTERIDRLRIAFASCSHYELGYFGAYRHMAAEYPDLVLFLGDYIYEFTVPAARADRIVRQHDGPTAKDLVGYRNRFALYRTDPDLQALHAAAPCLVTWDDHEVENDYADVWSQNVETSPEEFLRRRTAGYQAYYEHMPLRARSIPNGSAMRLHDRFRFGDLLTVALLDGRQYRSQQPCALPHTRGGHVTPDSCTERIDESRTLLGFAQERWLFDGFKTSDTVWNVLAQEQLVAQLRQKGADGVLGHWTEGWDGYAASRQRVLDAIGHSRLANPVFIGGDIHSFWATDLKADFGNPATRPAAGHDLGITKAQVPERAPAKVAFHGMLSQSLETSPRPTGVAQA